VGEQSARNEVERFAAVTFYLLRHNEEHTREIARLLQRAEGAGLVGLAEDLRQVARLSEQVSRVLEQGSARLRAAGRVSDGQ